MSTKFIPLQPTAMISRTSVRSIAILAAMSVATACADGGASKQSERVVESQQPAKSAPSAVVEEKEPKHIDKVDTTASLSQLDSRSPYRDPNPQPGDLLDSTTQVTITELPTPEPIDPWTYDSDLDGIAETRMVGSEIVKVQVRDARDTFDSVLVAIEQRLSIAPDPIERELIVERWLSPVNTKGYKFNRRKLILYGVESHYPLDIYHYMDVYYLSMGNRLYTLEESWQLAKFTLVADSALTAYLLYDENRL